MYILKTSLALTLFFSPILLASDAETEQQGILLLSPEHIADAKIEILNSSSVTLKDTFSIPAKITVNEYRQGVVVAKAPGIVTKISKNIGDTVQAQEILAYLESKEMAEAKAAYIITLKREDLAAQTLSAEESLKDKNISSEQDYMHVLLAAKEARINREVAEQQLYILGMTETDIQQLAKDEFKGLCCYQIKAPIAGIIIEKNISLGSLVSADQEVYKIANLDTVWVELGVNPKNLPYIKPGNKIIVTSLKEEHPTGEAVITHISPIIDEHTRTAPAIAVLSNISRNWFPGSFVNVKVITNETPVAIAVLKEAVHEIEGKNYIFLTHPNGFEKREVTTGRSDNKYIEIIAGIDLGTPYAATNTFVLKAEDGKKDAEL